MSDYDDGVLVYMHGPGQPVRFDPAWRVSVTGDDTLMVERCVRQGERDYPSQVRFEPGKWRCATVMVNGDPVADIWCRHDLNLQDMILKNAEEQAEIATRVLEQVEKEMVDGLTLTTIQDVEMALDRIAPFREFKMEEREKRWEEEATEEEEKEKKDE